MADSFMLADAPARLVRPGEPPVELLGRSPAIMRVQELIRRAASLDGGILITAEAGADVESVAREIHHRGRSADAPFVTVYCDDGDAASIDRLLFGQPAPEAATDLESVAFDSAIAAARGGTLYLHGVTELRASTQAQLARIARDGEVRIGGVPVTTALHLIASAQPGIDGDVHAHRFRADLYRRLSVVRLDLPPLRDRPADIPVLAVRLLEEACGITGCPPRTFTQAALALFGALTWPGNLAELRSAVQRVVAEGVDAVVQIEHLLPGAAAQSRPVRLRAVGQPARSASAIRTRLHRVRAAASRMADGARRSSSGYSASEPVPEGSAAGNSTRSGF